MAIRRLFAGRDRAVGRRVPPASPTMETLESRVLLSGTTLDVAPQPTRFEFVQAVDIDQTTYNVWDMAFVTDSDWTNSRLDLALTSGSLYQDPRGGDTEPAPAHVAMFPELEWDTYVTGPTSAASTLASTLDDNEIGATWFDVVTSEAGTFVLARMTLSTDANGTFTGKSYNIDTAGVGVEFVGTVVNGQINQGGQPTANAGDDQAVTDSDSSGAEIVTLDGSGSTDDGTIVSHVWTVNGEQIATGVSPEVSLAVGTHTVTLTVTDDQTLTHTDTVVVEVVAPADLSVTAPAAQVLTTSPGAQVQLDVTTLNGGNGAAGGAATVLLLRSDQNFDPAVEADRVAQQQWLGLAPGQSRTDTLTFTAPDQPGTYYARAFADGDGAVTESDETNNAGQIVTLQVDPTDEAHGWLFDEAFYLRHYPDVQAVLDAGGVASGYEHFMANGQYEKRRPSAFFDQYYYLRKNPDVKAVVEAGGLESAYAHFLLHGHTEARRFSRFYNEGFDRRQNPDVDALVTAGTYGSGYEHFVRVGQFQQRSFSPFFDEAYYLANNADVVALVNSGQRYSGYQHFAEGGYLEGRTFSPFFEEGYYVSNNPDVGSAIAGGSLSSGVQHFVEYGQFEPRPSFWLFDRTHYLTNNPDITAAGITAAYRHYIESGQYEGRAPSALFDPAYYLASLPEAPLSGSAFDHYLRAGAGEARSPSALFDEPFYLATYADAAALVANGTYVSGLHHYLLVGQAEGRLALPL